MLIIGKFKVLFRAILNYIENRTLYLRLAYYFKGKTGIEIGGPSQIFSYQLPVYDRIKTLDGCNFSNNTIWEGAIEEGNSYNYHKAKIGKQYILEASNLSNIPTAQYDFLLASHCLEHCANALKTMKEWKRVVKPGGHLLLVLPDKEFTFDHKRDITKYNHLVQDAKNETDERDLTHLDEILRLHDLEMDKAAGNLNNFKIRSLQNYENRCLHHHVFDFDLMIDMARRCGLKVKYKKWLPPFHQVLIVQKPRAWLKDVYTK